MIKTKKRNQEFDQYLSKNKEKNDKNGHLCTRIGSNFFFFKKYVLNILIL